MSKRWLKDFTFPLFPKQELVARIIKITILPWPGKEDPSIELMTSCLVSISTSLFISTNLGSLATPATTYLLIGLTVLMNAKELIQVLVAYRAGNLLPIYVENELTGLTVVMNAKELIHVLVAYRAGNLLPTYMGNELFVQNREN